MLMCIRTQAWFATDDKSKSQSLCTDILAAIKCGDFDTALWEVVGWTPTNFQKAGLTSGGTGMDKVLGYFKAVFLNGPAT